jgi:hypothetical protein
MTIGELIELLSTDGDEDGDKVVFNISGRYDMTVLSAYYDDGVLNIDIGNEGE